MRPRVLFVGRTRYRLPLAGPLARKWDALSELLELRVLASGNGSDPRFALVAPRRLDGPRFYAGLAGRVARELRTFRPEVVVAESPYEAVAVELARRLTRSPARLIVEVHGDWRVSTRLYGARGRAVLAPLGDRAAGWALGRADGHRALSRFTASLVAGKGREPLGVFPTYSDLGAFTGPRTPLPDEQRIVFVGVLERYKDVEGLARAWRLVAARLPGARLELIGSGTQVAVAKALAREGVEWQRSLDPPEVVRAIDRARALVLPSRSEGLGRVIIEAFLRGRPAIGTRVGGIPDLIEDGVNGLLVPVGEAEALAAAIERLLTDHALAERLGAAARETAAAWVTTPARFAENMRALVDAVLEGTAAAPAGSGRRRDAGR
jgi:glycosyltransferase involved in cell wall biosynthesis